MAGYLGEKELIEEALECYDRALTVFGGDSSQADRKGIEANRANALRLRASLSNYVN